MTDNTRRNPLLELVKPDAYINPNRILQTKYAESFNHFRDQVQFNSPLKPDPDQENLVSSPMQWNSPVTPPPSFTSVKTPIKVLKNPFDANLTEHLHLETFSPSVFSKVLSPSDDQDSNWRIEHVALLNPTEFSPNLPTHLADPNIEAEAQEKILQFFSQKQIAPSPWSQPRSRLLGRSKNKTPGEALQAQPVLKSAWTQTSLSFPPILPLEVEEVLSQYMNDPQDLTGFSGTSSSECDDSSLNTSSLRRKLFTQMSTTPSKRESDTYMTNPSQSSSPILMTGPHSSRFSFSPCSRPVSPPILSPICSNEENSVAMDETTRQSWGVSDLQPASFRERTVLMETYEAGCFGCPSNTVQSEVMNDTPVEQLFIADSVGQPVECSTPTKTQL